MLDSYTGSMEPFMSFQQMATWLRWGFFGSDHGFYPGSDGDKEFPKMTDKA